MVTQALQLLRHGLTVLLGEGAAAGADHQCPKALQGAGHITQRALGHGNGIGLRGQCALVGGDTAQPGQSALSLGSAGGIVAGAYHAFA